MIKRFSFNIRVEVDSPSEEDANAAIDNYCRVANSYFKESQTPFNIHFTFEGLTPSSSVNEEIDQTFQLWNNKFYKDIN